MTGYEQARPANPLWRRLLRQWRRWRGGVMAKTHTVQIVERDGQRFKRVGFESVEEADRVAACLRELVALDRFPRLLAATGSTLEVAYVAGPLARRGRASDHQAVADFFADLYCAQPLRAVSAADTAMAQTLASDLAILAKAGLIDARAAERLDGLANQWQPELVWLGHEYIDPIARNFVIRDGRAMAIDIEALWRDQPLGQGLAKAALRWLEQPVDAVLREVGERAGIELAPQYPWVQLCFTAAYFRQKLAQKKSGHIRIEALTALGRNQDSEP